MVVYDHIIFSSNSRLEVNANITLIGRPTHPGTKKDVRAVLVFQNNPPNAL